MSIDLNLLERIRDNDPTLREISFHNQMLNWDMFYPFSLVLQNSHVIKKLTLANVSLGDDQLKCLGQTLARNRTITHLNLASNKFTSKGVEFLSNGLFGNETLQTLILRDNQVGSEGALHLAAALSQNQFLMTLNLENCRLGDRGFVHLFSCLTLPTSLIEINLQKNDLNGTTDLIAKIIERNIAIQFLLLNQNPNLDSLQEDMFESPLKNRTLVLLNLDKPYEKYATQLTENKKRIDAAFDAIEKKQPDKLKQLFDEGLSPLAKDDSGDLLLHKTVKEKNFECLQIVAEKLLERKMPIAAINHEGMTALELAVNAGNYQFANALRTYTFRSTENKVVKQSSRNLMPLRDPSETHDQTLLKNVLSSKLDSLEKQRIESHSKLIPFLTDIQNQVKKSGRDAEILQMKIDLISMILNIDDKKDPDDYIKSLFLYDVKISISRYLRETLLPEIEAKKDENLTFVYKRWLKFEERLHASFDLPVACSLFDFESTLETEPLTLKSYVKSLNDDSMQKEFDQMSQLLSKFIDMNIVELTWEQTVGPKIKEIVNAWTKKIGPKEKPAEITPRFVTRLMNDVFRTQMLFFYEVETPKGLREFIEGREQKLSAEEQLNLLNHYMKLIDGIEKRKELSFTFPPFDRLKDFQMKLIDELAQLNVLIEKGLNQQSIWGTELHQTNSTILQQQTALNQKLLDRIIKTENSLIYLAAFGNFDEAMKCINAYKGPDKKKWMNQPNQTGQTPLQQACLYGRVNVVELLLKHGADREQGVKDEFENVYYPAHFACYGMAEESVKVLGLLKSKGANLNIQGARGRTPAHTACISNNVYALQFLLNNGVDPNTKEAEPAFFTLMHNAAFNGSVECVQLLLNRKAKVDVRDDRGNTPFMLALLKTGQQTIDKATNKPTLIYSKEHIAILKLLFQNGYWIADQDLKNLLNDRGEFSYIQIVLNQLIEEAKKGK